MTDIPDLLQAFLAETVDKPMVWGVSDCTTWPAEWVERACGVTLPHLAYADRDEARALIEKAGSLVAVWDEALAQTHLMETGVHEAGDVGIIETHAYGQCGGIFIDENYFAWRAEPQGYRVLRPRPRTILKVWSIR